MQTPGDRGSAGSRRLTRSAHDRGGGGGGGGGNGFASRLLLRSLCVYGRGGVGGGFAGRLLARRLCVHDRGGGGGGGVGGSLDGRWLTRSLCAHCRGGGVRVCVCPCSLLFELQLLGAHVKGEVAGIQAHQGSQSLCFHLFFLGTLFLQSVGGKFQARL